MIFLDNIVVKLKLMIYNVVFLIMNNTVLVELKIERRKMARNELPKSIRDDSTITSFILFDKNILIYMKMSLLTVHFGKLAVKCSNKL